MTKSKLSDPKELKCGDNIFIAQGFPFSDEAKKIGLEEQYYAYDAVEVLSVSWKNHKQPIENQYMRINEGEKDAVDIPLVNTNVNRSDNRRIFVSELDAVKYVTDENAQVSKAIDAYLGIYKKCQESIQSRLDQDAKLQKELEAKS